MPSFMDALSRQLAALRTPGGGQDVLNRRPQMQPMRGYVGGDDTDPGLYVGNGWNNPYDQERRADVMARAEPEHGDATLKAATERGAMQQLSGVLQKQGGPITSANRKQILATLTAIGKPPSTDQLLDDPSVDQENAMALVRERGAQDRQTQAERPAAGTGVGVVDTEAVDSAREIQRIARALKAAPGRDGAFGVMDSRLPTIRQSTADAEVLRRSLTGLLTLENTGRLKGVLSNADMQILREASTTIAPEMGDAAAPIELDRIVQVMEKIINPGGASSVSGATNAAPGKQISRAQLRAIAQRNGIDEGTAQAQAQAQGYAIQD